MSWTLEFRKRQTGQFVHKYCSGREENVTQDQMSLQWLIAMTPSFGLYELYEKGSDKSLWRHFVEDQITSGVDQWRWGFGPSQAAALNVFSKMPCVVAFTSRLLFGHIEE